MTMVRDKKRAEVTVKAAARKTRARVAKEEGESVAAEVRLPPWRELLGTGPAEGRQSAWEAEEASAPPAEAEQVPAEAKEDRPVPDQPAAMAAESAEPTPLQLEAPITEPEVAEAAAGEAEKAVEPNPVPDAELRRFPSPSLRPFQCPSPWRGQSAGVAPEPVVPAPVEDAPILRWSREPAMPPAERLAKARSLARVSGGEAPPSGLETLLPGMPAPLLREVSIHRDDAAARAAEHLRAEAFTIGTHVYFAHGRFAPHSPGGLALLAHELAHVAQYREGRLAGLPAVSQPSNAVEREADSLAERWRAPARVQAPRATPLRPPIRRTKPAPEPVTDSWIRPPSRAPPDSSVLRRATDTAKDFFDNSYFAQADEWSSVSGDIDDSLETDTQATTAAFPTPQAELGPASQAPTPVRAAPETLALGEQVPRPAPTRGRSRRRRTETPAAPATPDTPQINFGAEGDESAAQRNFSAALDQVPTSLDNVETSPGPAPRLN